MNMRVRLGTKKDAKLIEEFFVTPSTKYFGYLQPEQPVEGMFETYQMLRLIFEMHTRDDTIMMAFAQIRTYPNVLALPPDYWPHFIKHHYCVDLPITQSNTLFFNSYIYSEKFPQIMEYVLREIFFRENRLCYLITTKPPTHSGNDVRLDYSVLEKYSIIYYPKQFNMESCNNMQNLMIVTRDSMLRPIGFRKALPEDNDDIVDIIDYEEPELREDYGEFYIAEELLRQDPNSHFQRIIVGETIGKNVQTRNSGFIWLSVQFDLELLIKSYYLEPYGNLLTMDMTMKSHECRAFLLKRFNLHAKQRIESTFNFLCTTFSAYPNCDYLLVMLPKDERVSNGLKEVLKYCLPVPKRPLCQLPGDLYILHRSCLYGEMCIHNVVDDDFVDIEASLIGDDETKLCCNTILDMFVDSMLNPLTFYKFFTIRCGDAIEPREESTFLGFVIVREMCSYDKMFMEYVLPNDEDYLTYRRGEIIALKLHPFFQMRSEEFFRLLLAKTQYHDFYYIINPNTTLLPNDLSRFMMPVEPRPFKKYSTENLTTKIPKKQTLVAVTEIELKFFNERLQIYRHNMKPTRYFGNKEKIVIYGFSDEAKAFLRLLLFNWNSYDSDFVRNLNCVPQLNIVVITDEGIIDAEYDTEFRCSFCKTQKTCYIESSNCGPFVRDTTHRLDLRNWVHFIGAGIKHINRKNQNIILDSNCNIHYDKLLLMCRTHFGHPLHSSRKGVYPINCIHINCRQDKILLYKELQQMNLNETSEHKILVYGNNIATYECINFLLTHGVPKQCITLVVPYHQMDETELKEENAQNEPNNSAIDYKLAAIMQHILRDMGIMIYENLNINDWIYSDNENWIDFVHFKKHDDDVLIPIHCELFINFEEQHLPTFVERTLKLSGIAIKNRKILVNNNYSTNDPQIYAMGTYIKMVEEPYFQYTYVAPMEAGAKLMYYLNLSTIDNSEISPSEYNENKNEETRTFDRRYLCPFQYTAKLLQNFTFFKITMPKRFVDPNNPQKNRCSHKVMSTYNDGDTLRIGLTENNFVDQIIVITRKTTRLYFLAFFCGKHESMLNNIMLRYNAGLIQNFLTFFQQPWTELITHNYFYQLQAKNRTSLEKFFAEKNVDPNDIESIKQNKKAKRYINETIRNKLEQNLMQFLLRHQDDFKHEFSMS